MASAKAPIARSLRKAWKVKVVTPSIVDPDLNGVVAGWRAREP
jgi:hypothetical protein